MLGIRPRRQIGAAFANQFEHQRGPEPVNLCEVDTKHRIQNRPCIKGGSIGRIVSVPRGGQSANRPFRCDPQPSQYLLYSSVALGDLGLVEVVKVQRLTDGEYVLLPPIAGQSKALISSADAWQRHLDAQRVPPGRARPPQCRE